MAMLERSASRQESCALARDALRFKRVAIYIANAVGRGGVAIRVVMLKDVGSRKVTYRIASPIRLTLSGTRMWSDLILVRSVHPLPLHYSIHVFCGANAALRLCTIIISLSKTTPPRRPLHVG